MFVRVLNILLVQNKTFLAPKYMLGVMALQYDLNLFYVFCGEVLTKECCSVESIVNCSEIFIYLSIYLFIIYIFI